MKTIFEQMGGTYHREGDYLIPNLLPPEQPKQTIGKYGRMRQRYLQEHRRPIYEAMLMEGTLFNHLAEIDNSCSEQVERIIKQMAKQEGVTEALKASDQMAWIGAMNSIRNRAEEIVLREVLFA